MGCNITNTCLINEELMLCALNDPEGISKILTVNIEDGTTDEIVD